MARMTVADLDLKTPDELKRLLNLIKTNDLPFEEKKKWIEEIETRLGNPSRDERRIAEIQRMNLESAADLDDFGQKVREY